MELKLLQISDTDIIAIPTIDHFLHHFHFLLFPVYQIRHHVPFLTFHRIQYSLQHSSFFHELLLVHNMH